MSHISSVHENWRCCKWAATQYNNVLWKKISDLVPPPPFQYCETFNWIVLSLDLKNEWMMYECAMMPSGFSRGRRKLIIWPFDMLTQSTVSRDLDTDEPYPLPFAISLRGNGFYIPWMQLHSKMHLFLWRVRTICVTKALTAQSIPLTQDPFFTVRWDNSQTASELTNVTA